MSSVLHGPFANAAISAEGRVFASVGISSVTVNDIGMHTSLHTPMSAESEILMSVSASLGEISKGSTTDFSYPMVAYSSVPKIFGAGHLIVISLTFSLIEKSNWGG